MSGPPSTSITSQAPISAPVSVVSASTSSRAAEPTTTVSKRRKKSSASNAEGDLTVGHDAINPQSNEAAHPEKKNKACHACRRVKLRCVVDASGGPCKRCAARGEECVYTTPLHDLKWQQSIETRVEHLSDTMNYLVGIIGNIANQLSIPFQPPQSSSQTQLVPVVGPSRAHNKRARSPSAEASTSGRGPQSIVPEHDHWTRSGAESLLLQGYAHFSPPLELAPLTDLTTSAPLVPPQTSSVHQTDAFPMLVGAQTRDQSSASNSVFDLINSVTASRADTGDNVSADAFAQQSLTRLPGAVDLEIVGSQDPRPDVVKSGVVSSADAEVLLDFFHAQLAPHFNGFVLRMRAWPYLPAGKSTITPLVLSSICLVAAERLPRYHLLLDRLESSDLTDPILNATPGKSFAPGSELTAGNNSSSNNGLEPDLDPELGIGPEEISALLVYASFSSSSRSAVIARTAFEWARGYLKTFMLSHPRQITYGEVFGLLTAYRDLTFENWLRLWLIGYVVDVQQSLHQESLAPVFDPLYFCDTLLAQSATSPNLIEQQHDRELVAHARLCAIMQKIQYKRASLEWSSASSPETIIAAAEGWNAELDRWWSEQDLTTLTSDITLRMFKMFARIFVNLPTSNESALRADKWRFRSMSVSASWELLMFVKDEPQAGNVNVLFPFMVKMVLLSAIIVLDSFQDSLFMIMPCTLEQAMTVVSHIADSFASAPVPAHHPCLSASVALRTALERAKEMMTRAHNGFLGSSR
ncbi:hypothetical protein ACM66B_006940 [Microbotryomycetes sp. NB124-2]